MLAESLQLEKQTNSFPRRNSTGEDRAVVKCGSGFSSVVDISFLRYPERSSQRQLSPQAAAFPELTSVRPGFADRGVSWSDGYEAAVGPACSPLPARRPLLLHQSESLLLQQG